MRYKRILQKNANYSHSVFGGRAEGARPRRIHPIKILLRSIIVSGLFATALTASADFTAADAISHWNLEETSGVRADSTANNNDLSDNNTVLYGTGIIDNAADFELSTTEYLQITDASQTNLDINSDFSISVWANRESDVNGALVTKFDGNGGASDRAYAVMFDANSSSDISFAISNGSTATWAYKSYSFSTATWYHIVVVYHKAAGEVEFYINGTKEGTTVGSMPTSVANIDEPFRIGAAASGTYFDGLIDEVTVFDVALDADDVTALYNGGEGWAYPFEEEEPVGEPMATTSITIHEIYIGFTSAIILLVFMVAFVFGVVVSLARASYDLLK